MAGGKRLSTRILRWQVAILIGTLLVGFGLTVVVVHSLLVRQFEERALAVARAVQVAPGIASAVVAHDPGGVVQQRAEAIRKSTHALFVVVTDSHGIRYSHPNPDRLGEEVSTSPDDALAGDTVLAVQRGTLGLSARAKVPLRDAKGRIVGEVSVGIAADEIDNRLLSLLPSVALYLGLALIVGMGAAVLLARRLKRQTFGLELGEIASLLQEREATLFGIREGVVAVDPNGVVSLMNDEARSLLGLSASAVGSPLVGQVQQGRLADALTGRPQGTDQVIADQVVLTDRHCLVINRVPVSASGRDLGWVITMSDRSELENLLRELDSVRGLTDALRAQQHEFGNRVHALAGLIELGRYEDALRYAAELSGPLHQGLAERLQQRIDSAELVGLLVAKSVVAAERGVRLAVSDDSGLAAGDADSRALLTIVGNLVDNAIDAAQSGPGLSLGPPRDPVTGVYPVASADPVASAYAVASADPVGGGSPDPERDTPVVTVTLLADGDDVTIRVRDTGAGIAPRHRERIFVDGFSTKPPARDRSRGLGLALVHRTVVGAGGTIAVDSPGAPGRGTTFTVTIPRHRAMLDPVRG